ncbi:MAG: hypothetical protein ACUZ8I_14595 [Candidatus Scalindua sp.]
MKVYSGNILSLFLLILFFCSAIKAEDLSKHESSDIEKMIEDEFEKLKDFSGGKINGDVEIKIKETYRERNVRAIVDPDGNIRIVEDSTTENKSDNTGDVEKKKKPTVFEEVKIKSEKRDDRRSQTNGQTDKEQLKKNDASVIEKWGYITLGVIFLLAIVFGVVFHGSLSKYLLLNNAWRLLVPMFAVVICCVLTRYVIDSKWLQVLDFYGDPSLKNFVGAKISWFVPVSEPDLSYLWCSLAGIVFYFILGGSTWLVWYFKIGRSLKHE